MITGKQQGRNGHVDNETSNSGTPKSPSGRIGSYLEEVFQHQKHGCLGRIISCNSKISTPETTLTGLKEMARKMWLPLFMVEGKKRHIILVVGIYSYMWVQERNVKFFLFLLNHSPAQPLPVQYLGIFCSEKKSQLDKPEADQRNG